MSHFTVGVIYPKTTENIHTYLTEILAPFSENLEVEPYQRECWCVGSEAKHFGRKKADKLVGTWEDRRNLFRTEHPRTYKLDDPNAGELEAAHDKLWDEFNKEFKEKYVSTATKYETEHAEYNKPNPKCSQCMGVGTYESTYNPESQWDWYRIGGRWNGDLIDLPRDDGKGGFNFDDGFESPAENSVPVQELLEREKLFMFFSMVTPDGEWIEKADMGWWGMTSNEKPEEDWEAITRATYTKYADYNIILVDAHI